MHIIKRVRFESLLPAIKEVLSSGSSLRLTVTGSSMYPFLRDGEDSVELISSDMDCLRTGDIALVQHNGRYILHRIVLKKKDSFYTAGDSQQSIEGPFYSEDIIAAVKAIWRADRYIPCSNNLWKLLSTIWLILFPFRYLLIKLYHILFSRVN